MTINQRTVERIIARAKQSDLGLNEPIKNPNIGNYAQHNLQSLGLLLVDCWEAKYDLCALMTAAMEIVAEDAGANSELTGAKRPV